jgi:hypothetical protein
MAIKRNGLRKIRNFAHQICRLVAFWSPVIQIAFSGNLALSAALNAANQACALLVEEADKALPNEDDA